MYLSVAHCAQPAKLWLWLSYPAWRKRRGTTSNGCSNSWTRSRNRSMMLTNPGSRTSAVNYLARRLPSRLKQYLKSLGTGLLNPDLFTTTSSQPILSEVIGPDGGLLVRALAAGLEDDSLLVRRGTLDLLNSCLPLPSLLSFADFSPTDKKILIKSACGIVLRRDLSLNKRLYGWFLGNEEESEKQMDRFRSVGLDLVRAALLVSQRRKYFS
jgi:hypothetical protein